MREREHASHGAQCAECSSAAAAAFEFQQRNAADGQSNGKGDGKGKIGKGKTGKGKGKSKGNCKVKGRAEPKPLATIIVKRLQRVQLSIVQCKRSRKRNREKIPNKVLKSANRTINL